MSDNFDVIVIGSGPAGYVAAIRAGQLGMNVACIEKWRSPNGASVNGGTCLNVGCIPSKALLDSSHKYYDALKKLGKHGITTGAVKIDIAEMMGRKDKIVSQLTGGIGQLFKANNVTGLYGTAKLLSNKEVQFVNHDGEESTIKAPRIVLAAGSVPIEIPAAQTDGDL